MEVKFWIEAQGSNFSRVRRIEIYAQWLQYDYSMTTNIALW